MGRFAVILGLVAFATALLSSGMYWGMGLGGFAATCGYLAYSRPETPSWSRITGAFGMTVGLVALTIAVGRFGTTWWAVGRLTDMLITS